MSIIDDISEAEIGCVDYALNQTYYDMDYFLDKVGAELASIEQLKSMTQAEFNIKNNTSDEVSADFILAFYDDADRLVEMSIQNYKIGANSEEALSYAFFKNTQEAAYAKLFVWDAEQLKPVDRLKRFTLNE